MSHSAVLRAMKRHRPFGHMMRLLTLEINQNVCFNNCPSNWLVTTTWQAEKCSGLEASSKDLRSFHAFKLHMGSFAIDFHVLNRKDWIEGASIQEQCQGQGKFLLLYRNFPSKIGQCFPKEFVETTCQEIKIRPPGLSAEERLYSL